MLYLTRSLLACMICLVSMLHLSEAMYGLCSNDWFHTDPTTPSCFDLNDECAREGGKCYSPGVGDHGEGCVCLKEVFRQDHWEYMTLTKDHFNGKGRMLPEPFPIKVTKLPPNKTP